jgi:hypothetical protein
MGAALPEGISFLGYKKAASKTSQAHRRNGSRLEQVVQTCGQRSAVFQRYFAVFAATLFSDPR